MPVPELDVPPSVPRSVAMYCWATTGSDAIRRIGKVSDKIFEVIINSTAKTPVFFAFTTGTGTP
jgi:hypothetical protein